MYSSSRRSPDSLFASLFPQRSRPRTFARRPLRWFGLPACTASPGLGSPITDTARFMSTIFYRHHSPFRTHAFRHRSLQCMRSPVSHVPRKCVDPEALEPLISESSAPVAPGESILNADQNGHPFGDVTIDDVCKRWDNQPLRLGSQRDSGRENTDQ